MRQPSRANFVIVSSHSVIFCLRGFALLENSRLSTFGEHCYFVIFFHNHAHSLARGVELEHLKKLKLALLAEELYLAIALSRLLVVLVALELNVELGG